LLLEIMPLSLVDFAMKAIEPVLLSTPIRLGGLGLPPSSIGTLLSVQGLLNGIFSIFFFAKIHDRWGPKKTFIAGVASAIPAIVMFPVANALARTQGYSIAVWIAIGIQIIAVISHNLSFGQYPLHNLRTLFSDGWSFRFRSHLYFHIRRIP
jgi:MFS family permease